MKPVNKFLSRIEKTLNPSPASTAEENREAIEYLAEELAELKHSRERTTSQKFRRRIRDELVSDNSELEQKLESILQTQEEILKHLQRTDTQQIQPQPTPEEEKPVDTSEEEPQEEEPDSEYVCLLCGDSYDNPTGFAGHLTNKHHVSSSDVEDIDVAGERITDKLNSANKNSEEIRRVKDALGEVATPIEERDFPRWESGEKLSSTHWSVDERKHLVKQLLKDADRALTTSELTKRIYNLDKKPIPGEKTKRYGNLYRVVRDLADEGEIVKVDSIGGQYAYAIPGSDQDVSLKKNRGKSDAEPVETKISDATHTLEQKKNIDGRRELNSYKNTFAKVIHDKNLDEITYYDFSSNWGGDQNAIDAYQTLFTNSVVLNEIRREVCPEKSFKWKRLGNGRDPSNWVIEVT